MDEQQDILHNIEEDQEEKDERKAAAKPAPRKPKPMKKKGKGGGDPKKPRKWLSGPVSNGGERDSKKMRAEGNFLERGWDNGRNGSDDDSTKDSDDEKEHKEVLNKPKAQVATKMWTKRNESLNNIPFRSNSLFHSNQFHHGASQVAMVVNDASLGKQLTGRERTEAYSTMMKTLVDYGELTVDEAQSKYQHFLKCECKLMLQTTIVNMHVSTVAMQHIERISTIIEAEADEAKLKFEPTKRIKKPATNN